MLHSWVTFVPPTLQHETHSKATPAACIAFQSRCNPRAVGTVSQKLLGVFYVFSVSHLPGIAGRKIREDLWPWAMPPESCLRDASPGMFSNIQHAWDLGACTVNLATSLLSRDGADCWQLAKVGTAAKKCHLQTWGRVQRELKYHYGFSCLCASGKIQKGNCITSRQMFFFNYSLQKMKPILLFPCVFLALSIWIIGRFDGFSSPGKLGEKVVKNTDKKVLSATVRCFMLTSITKPTICHLGYYNHVKHISRLIFDGSVGIIKSSLKKKTWNGLLKVTVGGKQRGLQLWFFVSQSHHAWLWLLSIYCLFSYFWK